MTVELDQLMFEAWKKIEDRVLGDEVELRRRLARREKVFDSVPRPLCLAIRAADRRLTPWDVWMSPRWPMNKGEEAEHDVLLNSRLMKELCRPVKVEWGRRVSYIQEKMGCSRATARLMHKRGLFCVRGIQGLGGQRGYPVLLVDSPFPPLLDPCSRGHAADGILGGLWEHLCSRLPNDVEQMVRRKPVFRVNRDRRRVMNWYWVCPGCKREVTTIYFPMGAPNWAALHDIKLPEGEWYETPYQRGCFACWKCHNIMGLCRTERSIGAAWGHVISHLSGGLLYGRDVPRPASFSIVRKVEFVSRKSRAPRSDELENYLVNTDLPLPEIARRMEQRLISARGTSNKIYRKRGVKGGREGLREWWAKHRPAEGKAAAAA